MRSCTFLIVALALAAALPAQTYTDAFNYANGLTIPGWTKVTGQWSIVNKQLQAEQRGLWQYLVKDGFQTLNGMCEVLAIYNGGSSMKLQFGGCTMRFVGTGDCVMDKIQDNNSSGDFDRFFVYDQPGSSKYVDPKTHKICVVRLGTIDGDLIGKIDIDGDGRWDHVVVKSTTKTPTVGKVGVAGYGGCLIDYFKYFDAIVRIDPTGLPPKPGNAVTLELRGDPSLTYQCACSLYNMPGIQLGTRMIPLTPENLMVLSIQNPVLFQRFTGVLDGSGKGKAAILIPFNPALTGLAFFFGMITLDQKSPFGVRNISNDLRIEIQ